MQKKLIALAVAGLMSAPAFAQSNVTVYGLFDIGLAHYSDSAVSGKANRTGIDQGFLNGSRLGFKGVEDLGNGLKASFLYEFNVGTDYGGDVGGGRQTVLALSGNFGTLALGRMYTPQFNLYYEVDPFGAGSVGNVANLSRVQTRLDNVVAYVTPSFSGFNVTAAYTMNGRHPTTSAAVDEVDNDNGIRVWAISPAYKNGPLYVGLNYHVATVKATGASDFDAQKRLDIGASYDFGVVKLSGTYGVDKAETAVAGVDNEAKYWMLGVSAPVGVGKVMASYNSYKDEDGLKGDADMWAVGYEHPLSKRTKVYAIYAAIDNDDTAKSVAPSSVTGTYQKGLQVAIQHRF
ncbi:MAG: porin [Betaproteobacteria bacterium HGW-Betaproteobacteria-13]|jgi:predicted porin|nr:MAG: porin [Betaproteobacteria bacterium HGW-Betaproteobacteria-21]PKO81517.1 MAG: porin [Betaproteobacteria bacterium HGW-Betaproteobacteria-13]